MHKYPTPRQTPDEPTTVYLRDASGQPRRFRLPYRVSLTATLATCYSEAVGQYRAATSLGEKGLAGQRVEEATGLAIGLCWDDREFGLDSYMSSRTVEGRLAYGAEVLEELVASGWTEDDISKVGGGLIAAMLDAVTPPKAEEVAEQVERFPGR